MLGGGGVDGAIHRAAGRQLLEACYDVPPVPKSCHIRCPTGEARITPGFRLDAKFVIHTVGPFYENSEESAPLLRSAIKNSLLLCKEKGLKSIAFPAISCGVYGYPPHEAAEIAIDTMLKFSDGIDLVEFVLFGKDTYDPFFFEASEKLEVVEQAADSKTDEPGDPTIATTKVKSEAEREDTANAAAKISPTGSKDVSATAQGTAPTEGISGGDATTVEPMSQQEGFSGLDGSNEAVEEEPITREETSGEPGEATDSTNDAEPMSQSAEDNAASDQLEEAASSGVSSGMDGLGEQDLLDRKRARPGAGTGQTAEDDVPSSGDQGVAMETDEAHQDSGTSGEEKPQDGDAVSDTCDSSAATEGPSA
ncbi:unnamed protein product [Hapterophycus canaliculatus]